MAALIETRDLQKAYQMGEVSVQALRGVDLSVTPGEFVAIMGPSGSGKSTLLHLLGGLEAASQGEVVIGERRLSDLGEHGVTLLRRRKIGVVFQFYNLIPTMTAEENVGLPLLLDGVPAAERTARAAEALAWVGLAERARHTPDRLSGGEQRRLRVGAGGCESGYREHRVRARAHRLRRHRSCRRRDQHGEARTHPHVHRDVADSYGE